MKKEHIPEPILEQIENELLAGERILWVGVPGKRHIPGASDLVRKSVGMAMLGLMFLGLVAFMVTQGSTNNSDGIWLVVAGVTISVLSIFALVFQTMRSSSHQLYAITNRRAMILSQNKVQSFLAKDLQFVERTMHRDGSGDIIFREDHYKRVVPAGVMIAQHPERITTGFYGVENPAEVEALILETFNDEPGKSRLVDESLDQEILVEEQRIMYR